VDGATGVSSGIGVEDREVSRGVELPVEEGRPPSTPSSWGNEKFWPRVDFRREGFPPSQSLSDCREEAPETFRCMLLPILEDEDDPDLSRGLLGVRMGEFKNC
jgi:hypothetical protein